uniref:hypothetical protein n=1 Tax=Streptomyces sp. NRRL F-6674 TaxID=1463877 RepID=UPI000524B2E2
LSRVPPTPTKSHTATPVYRLLEEVLRLVEHQVILTGALDHNRGEQSWRLTAPFRPSRHA